MNIYTHKGRDWYYDPDLDRTSWKSPEQIDEGFRLPAVNEVLELWDYVNPPLDDNCPFRDWVWTCQDFKDTMYQNGEKKIIVDLSSGQVYRTAPNNIRLLILVKDN